MKWPWQRDRRLARAQQEQKEIKNKSAHRERLAQRAEQHLREDSFGQAFHRALGGRA
jgi:hypothetical protein